MANSQNQGKAKIEDLDTRSIGDQATFAEGRGQSSPQSLGDQMTLGGGGDFDDTIDDGMEVVDLATRYKIEGTLGKGGMGEVLLAIGKEKGSGLFFRLRALLRCFFRTTSWAECRFKV